MFGKTVFFGSLVLSYMSWVCQTPSPQPPGYFSGLFLEVEKWGNASPLPQPKIRLANWYKSSKFPKLSVPQLGYLCRIHLGLSCCQSESEGQEEPVQIHWHTPFCVVSSVFLPWDSHVISWHPWNSNRLRLLLSRVKPNSRAKVHGSRSVTGRIALYHCSLGPN